MEPSVKFVVKGNVVDSVSKHGIENIRVVMNVNTTYTDTEGKYEVSTYDMPTSSEYHVMFKDVDGKLNDEFNDKNIDVDFKDIDMDLTFFLM